MKQVLKTWKPRLVVVSAGFSEDGEGSGAGGQFGMSREEIAAVHLSYPRAHIITTGCPDHTNIMVSRREAETVCGAAADGEFCLVPEGRGRVSAVETKSKWGIVWMSYKR